METRANYVWVGAVTLALLALAAAMFVWIARLNKGEQNTYDIYFTQAVDGLAKGSQVNYSGVPVGQITQIAISPRDPGTVRVRVAVDERVPILEGTVATLQGSFTGVSTVQLAGGEKGHPPITKLGQDGVPEIPTRRSGLGALLSNAPLLMQRLTEVTERVGQLLSDRNLHAMEGILANTNSLTGKLAGMSPQMQQTVGDLDATLVQATATLAEFQGVAGRANAMLDDKDGSLLRQLNRSLVSAQTAADTLKATLDDTRPIARQLASDTLPQAQSAIRELRSTSKALRELTEKIDNQGLAGAVSAPKLPEYKK
jgi:phospholipid/cholesterol/gamma-HCH transport system substrate-binding protein